MCAKVPSGPEDEKDEENEDHNGDEKKDPEKEDEEGRKEGRQEGRREERKGGRKEDAKERMTQVMRMGRMTKMKMKMTTLPRLLEKNDWFHQTQTETPPSALWLRQFF